jgi:hypothetical protein
MLKYPADRTCRRDAAATRQQSVPQPMPRCGCSASRGMLKRRFLPGADLNGVLGPCSASAQITSSLAAPDALNAWSAMSIIISTALAETADTVCSWMRSKAQSIMHASVGSSDQPRAAAVLSANRVVSSSRGCWQQAFGEPCKDENSNVIEDPCFLASAHVALHTNPDAPSSALLPADHGGCLCKQMASADVK